MEPVTQALLGAATGELAAGHRLGRRALGWGAIIGMLPDLDVLLAPLHNGYGEWLYHRGTTHSLWFGFVAGPLLGWFLWRWRDREKETPASAWIALAVVALFTHPILDGFTPYGTQFFAPFSRARFAWNGVAIVDPFYTIPLAVGVFVAVSRRLRLDFGRFVLSVSLATTTAYLLAGLALNQWVLADLDDVFRAEGRDVDRIRAYPTIFQPWLRSFVVHTPLDTIVGLHSLTDPGCPSWRVHPHPDPRPEIDVVLGSWQGELLRWFADGDIGVFVSPTAHGTRVRVEDLRYSWSNRNGRGMWGLSADVVDGDLIDGEITRFDRPPLAPGDLDRFAGLLLGDLPGGDEGWSRPSNCASPTR